MEHDRKPIHLTAEQRFQSLGRYIARREAGAAGCQDDVNPRVGDPPANDLPDLVDFVLDDGTLDQCMACSRGPVAKEPSGRVRLRRACIRNGEHRDIQWVEGKVFINSRHLFHSISQGR